MDVKKELLKINTFLEECLWMDFDYGIICDYLIELFGCIDRSFPEDAIKIKFVCPHYISTTFYFSKADDLPFIELVEEQEQIAKYVKMGLEEGDFVFQIHADECENPIIIVAQSVECEIIKHPFRQNKDDGEAGCLKF